MADINANYDQKLATDNNDLSIYLPLFCQSNYIVKALNEWVSGKYAEVCDQVRDNNECSSRQIEILESSFNSIIDSSYIRTRNGHG